MPGGRMGAVGAKPATGAPTPFSPLDIAWHTAFWAEGPAFTALGLSDGAAVSTMPDEASGFGSATQATGTQQPVYRAADADFNSQPAIDGDGSDDYLSTTAGTAIGQPCTIAVVGKFFGTGRSLVDGPASASAYEGMLYLSGGGFYFVFSPTGADTNIAGNANAHLFIVELNGASTTLQVDGTVSGSVSPGANSPTGVTLLGSTTSATYADKFNFYGIKPGTLTAQEKTDLRTWAQTHCGTP